MNPLLLPVLSPLLDLGKMVIARFIPDPEKKREAEIELIRMAAAGELQQVIAQLEINAKEATHPSIFVAGWRPAVGWVCVAAMAFQYLVRPLMIGFGIADISMPGLDDNLWAILTGILGIGGLRSLEKVTRVTK